MRITKFSHLLLGISAFVGVAQVATLPVYAQTGDTTQQTAPSTDPVVTFTYKAPNFLITAGPNVKRVTYTIEYVRVSTAGDVTEGLQSGGKAPLKGKFKGRYSGRVYAGTQSSRYFIPHRVKSAHISLKGTTLDRNTFSYTNDITVTQPTPKRPVVKKKVLKKH